MNSVGGWNTMPGCRSSGLRPNGTVPASAAQERLGAGVEHHEGGEHRGDDAEHRHRAAREPLEAVEVDDGDDDGRDGEQQQPEQERALLPGPEPRDAVERGERRVGVLRHVSEAEVLLEERLQQHRRGDDRGQEEAVDRVVAVALEVLTVPAETHEEESRGGARRRRAQPKASSVRAQASGDLTARAAGDADPLYLLGHLVCNWSAVISWPLLAYLPMTTTSTPASNVLGICPRRAR